MNGFWWLFLLFVIGLIIAAIFGFFNAMPWLLGQILICLLLAAILGAMLGWLLKSIFGGGWKTKYDELNARFNNRGNEIDGIRADLNARNSAYADLETNFLGVKADLDASRLGREDIRAELAARTDRMASLETQLLGMAEKDAEIERLKLQLGDWDKDKARLAELDADLGKLKLDYDARLTSLQTAEAKATDLEAKLGDYDAQLKAKDSSLADLKLSLENAQAEKDRELNLRLGELEGLRSSLVERDQRLGLLEADYSSLQANTGDVETFQVEIDNLKADLGSRNSRIAELELELANIQQSSSEASDLELELGSVRNTINDRDARILDLEAQLAGFRASNGKAGQLEADLDDLRADLKNRNVRISELEANFASAKADLEASRLGRQDISTELAARTDRMAELEAEVLSLRADLDASRQGREDITAELSARTNRMAELETQLGATATTDSSDLDNLRADLKNRNARIAELEADIASVKADLSASRQGREDITAELSARTNRMAELESKLVSAAPAAVDTSELDKLRDDLNARNARIAELELSLKTAQEADTNANLEAELASLRAGLAERDNRISGLESSLVSQAPAAQPGVQAAAAPAAPKPKRKPRKKKEIIGYRVTRSRVFRADVVPEGHDPLGVIEGIGNANQQKLWDAGILSFKDLSELPEDRLKEIIGSDDAFYDEWIIEARRFTRGVYKLSQATTGGSRGRADDLTRIEGIGPKMNAALLDAGIRTFEELEAASETQLRSAIEASGLKFAPSIVTWSKQAAYLVKGDEEGFKEYTDYLVAGRDEGKRS